MTGWGVEISPKGGGQFEEQGGGREGELFKKMPENNAFVQKKSRLCLHHHKNFDNFLEYD